MLDTLKKKMYALSGGTPIRHTVPAEHVDDLSTMGRGRCWTQTAHTEPREHALMHSMVRQDRWNLSSVDHSGDLVWNKVACRDFMRAAAEMVDLIITLIHIGSGPPLRGEEIIRDQISNGTQPRTLYLIFGQMVAIRRHEKTTNSKGMDAFNVCYFPQSLTDAVCYYLLVIRPLEKLVAHHLYEEDEEAVMNYNLYLYVKHGRKMTSPQFSTTLERMTSQYMEVGLSLQPLRHILIAFQRAYVEELRVHRGDNIGDLISSHTSKTADEHYAIEHGQPEGQTATYLLDVQEWCDSYHDAIGLGDQTIPLIPLRVSRRQARQLGSIASAPGPRDPVGKVDGILPLITELTTTAYKSALEDLKPFISREVRSATNDAMEYLILARSLPDQPPGSTSAPESPGNRPMKGLPPRTSPRPPPPTSTHGAEENRRIKRVLSSGEQQPQAKRQPGILASLSINPPTPPEPAVEISTAPFDSRSRSRLGTSSNLGRVADSQRSSPQTPVPEPTTQPSTPLTGIADLPMAEVEDESTTISKFSSMSLGVEYRVAPRVEGPRANRTGFRTMDSATDRVGSQVADWRFDPTGSQTVGSRTTNDAGLQGTDSQAVNNTGSQDTDNLSSQTNFDLEIEVALQKLRRDLSATFKSPAQRELVTSVVSGRHTIGVLPTGGGKSLAFELPTLVKGQVTIAAFPYKVIVSQAAKNCNDRGVPYERWTSLDTRSTTTPKLVLMAIETLVSFPMLE